MCSNPLALITPAMVRNKAKTTIMASWFTEQQQFFSRVSKEKVKWLKPNRNIDDVLIANKANEMNQANSLHSK